MTGAGPMTGAGTRTGAAPTAPPPAGTLAVAPGPACPRPVYAAAALLLGSFLVGFDTRLFTVGLPDLRGAYGLSFDQGAWLNTFATAPQIFIAPAVAWLTAVFGVRRMLVGPSLLYAALSFVLPQVEGWPALVMLHVLRGLLLGMFIPATIMIIFRNLPVRWWLPALGLYAFRLAFSLNTGPLLIGLYDGILGWQWIYWQDMLLAPLIGLLAYAGTPPERVDVALLERADWGGMALLGAGAALIFAGLDQGNRLDWFQSGLITCLIGGGAVLMAGFLVNERLVRYPWASHEVIARRNILVGFLLILAYATTSLSNTQLVPGFLSGVANLRPEEFGLPIFLTAGLPLIPATLLTVWVMRQADARYAMLVGFSAFALAAHLGTRLTADWGPWSFAPMGLLQALGHPMALLGAIVCILVNSDPKRATAAAAYIQVLRLGGAETAGTVMATLLRRREQLHSYLLGLHLPAGGDTGRALGALAGPLAGDGASPDRLAARATLDLAGVVSRQANVLALIDAFQITFWAALVGLLLVAALRAPPPGPLVPKAGS